MITFFHTKSKNIRGFTLVEMVLYVSVCAIILLSLSTFLSFLLSSRVKSQAINEVNQQGFQVMNLIAGTIRNGRSIQTPAIGTSSSTLSLTTAYPLLNPTIFSLSSTTLTIKEGSSNPIALTNSRIMVSSLLFQNVSSASTTEKVIRFSFVIDYINPQGRAEYSYAKTFSGSATLH
jgi:type II secretory pathway pseudopilin PulG